MKQINLSQMTRDEIIAFLKDGDNLKDILEGRTSVITDNDSWHEIDFVELDGDSSSIKAFMSKGKCDDYILTVN